MSVAPDPSEIFERAVEEGNRRLGQSLLELVSNGFIAGFTIIFGVVALALVEGYIPSGPGSIDKIAGALAFGIGLVFLIVGRVELFNENFFDPVAAAVDRSDSWALGPLLRLWVVTFATNLVGGALFALVFTVDGALPQRAVQVLIHTAEELAHRRSMAVFAKAIVGGALVSLLSFLAEAVNSVGSRIVLAYVVGVFLTLGPFDHVIVTILHIYFGYLFGADVGLMAIAMATVVVTAGNIVGGIGLVTFSHVAEAAGSDGSSD